MAKASLEFDDFAIYLNRGTEKSLNYLKISFKNNKQFRLCFILPDPKRKIDSSRKCLHMYLRKFIYDNRITLRISVALIYSTAAYYQY